MRHPIFGPVRRQRLAATSVAAGVLLLLTLGVSTSCAIGARSGANGEADFPYDGPFPALFDDAVSPGALGAPSDEPSNGEPTARLIERVRTTDTIAPIVVTTVAETRGETGRVLELDVRPEGNPIWGKPLSGPQRLRLSTGSTAYVLLSSGAATSLAGARLILFAKTFTQDGVPNLHWHSEADNEANRAATQKARAMIEIRQ
jgi:hypothetical protein